MCGRIHQSSPCRYVYSLRQLYVYVCIRVLFVCAHVHRLRLGCFTTRSLPLGAPQFPPSCLKVRQCAGEHAHAHLRAYTTLHRRIWRAMCCHCPCPVYSALSAHPLHLPVRPGLVCPASVSSSYAFIVCLNTIDAHCRAHAVAWMAKCGACPKINPGQWCGGCGQRAYCNAEHMKVSVHFNAATRAPAHTLEVSAHLPTSTRAVYSNGHRRLTPLI